MTKSLKAASRHAHKKAVPAISDLPKITTTIKREWLCEIAAGRKRVEYREIKPYWTRRLSQVKAPFLLRLINGMQPNAPELTALVSRVRKNRRSGEYELHMDSVIDLRHWDLKLEQPTEVAISKGHKLASSNEVPIEVREEFENLLDEYTSALQKGMIEHFKTMKDDDDNESKSEND